MKKYTSIFKLFIVLFSLFLVNSCVHDDEYAAPGKSNNQCADLKPTMTLTQLKALYKVGSTTGPYIFPSDTDAVVEGYVSSSDETGNIYKTIYIQDSPTDPTEGLTISVDAVSTYLKYPQGSKIYIKLKDLALGEYGQVIQLGTKSLDPTNTRTGSVARISEADMATHIFQSCTAGISEIKPKVITLKELGKAMDQYIGVLVQVNDAEFHKDVLCTTYAPTGTSVDKPLTDKTSSTKTKVVRNSGYASFANQLLPSGNGTFKGILSKFNTTYQFYINKPSDLNMTGARMDGIVAPCSLDTSAMTVKTVADVKAMLQGNSTLITDDIYIKGRITANDEKKNLYRYFYIQDDTGGIKVNANSTELYLDSRFQVGKELMIKLKDLFIFNVNGELQLGLDNKYKQVEIEDFYKYFFGSNSPINYVVATEKTIPSLTTADVGKWIKIKDLQFIDSDLGKTYADGTFTTNRTLEDCSGNKIILRTSGDRSNKFENTNFGTRDEPLYASTTEIDSGKGDVYGILSIYNGTYQLWITKLRDIDLDNPRCDGSLPLSFTNLYNESFDATLSTWKGVSVTGDQIWKTQDKGSAGNFYAVMSGFAGVNKENEDWLINASAISLTGGTKFYLSFDNDKRYSGNDIEVYITDNYTGTPSSTKWTKLSPTLDTDDSKFGWVNSGKLDISAFAGKNIYIGFKYTSTTSSAATWEIDNIQITAAK